LHFQSDIAMLEDKQMNKKENGENVEKLLHKMENM
jgi:hypothetical protein